jgi:hypothetical protein
MNYLALLLQSLFSQSDVMFQHCLGRTIHVPLRRPNTFPFLEQLKSFHCFLTLAREDPL